MQSTVVVLFAALLMATPATAATINLPDQMGTNVTFTNITETSDDATTFSLFSGINAYNDTLDFDAFNFRQNSLALNPSLDGRLDFTVTAKPGQFIQRVIVREVGSYTTINDGIAQVFLGGVGTGAQVGQGSSDSTTLNFGPGAGINSGLWDATISFDNFHQSEEVDIQLDNRLTTIGDINLGDYAFLDKKLVLVTVLTNIPEPSSLAFLLGSAGMVAIRRRKRA